MKELTKITDTLFCVEVPMEAMKPALGKNSKGVMFDYWLPVGHSLDAIEVNLPDGKYKLLGYGTDKEISFPVDGDLLEKIYLHDNVETGFIGYKDYTNEENCFVYSDLACKKKSFRSLLLSKGLYWDNPNGCEPELIDFVSEFISDEELRDAYKYNHSEWQSLEAAKLTGKLVFFKLIN